MSAGGPLRLLVSDHDQELDDLFGQLERAGVIQVYTDADGQQAVSLTEQGQRVANRLALAGDDGIVDVLLDDCED
jgi:hypothetical protein